MKKASRSAPGMALWLVAVLMAGVQLMTGQTALPGPVAPQGAFDLNHMRGTWYEIARYPDKAQKDCGRNNFDLIALGTNENSVDFVNSCTGKHGDIDIRNASVKQAKKGNVELKARRLLIFSRKYRVVALGANDAWMLFGNANHKELWLLAKTPTMDAQTLADAQAHADSSGFSSAKLVMTPQDAPAAH